MPSRTSTPLDHPEERELEFARVMAALSDPVRLGIIATLADHPGLPCGRFDLPVGKSAASRHFRVLREAGLLRQWDDGTRRRNDLRRAELDRRFPGLLDLAIDEGRRRGRAGVSETEDRCFWHSRA
ncbi:ArsR/SmtB family transcription factor [Streptomonospora nanhaiensis]|uniref:DNA-binding transcriptional ArsR family regulator n=1 Tax=Streptomonospora nanhaiensis TaxID=1323731 RepID=A0A853BV96_9ACTN|nr:helix-turn-helix transcriptional regulator [Streptomonospora nanhaiensis]MBV2365582.1 ArsR family transcriptional regulator [Streptomonospora nanhaiensis]MBX9387136.1 ArsR family transcriptional regulator [Streptomonospora nanhaiensis]NYI98924.1 DNA-binding transcriptional ArsR family regulator [Streptomonospora nanhaiensis]